MALTTERLAQLVAERDAAAAAASAAASAAAAETAARLAASEAAGVALAEDVLDWAQIQQVSAIDTLHAPRLDELLTRWLRVEDRPTLMRTSADVLAFIAGVQSVRDAVLAE